MTEQDRSAAVVAGAKASAPEAGQGSPAAQGLRNGARVRRRAGPVYAALDLGTNNCRLLIAKPSDDGFRVVDGFSRIVRLGESLSRTGMLTEGAMGRTLEALAQCKARLDAHEVKAGRFIATEACRAAGNAPAFLKRVKDEIGIELEVVDRRTEAELAVTGCADLVDPAATGVVLFDIGGGSTELAWLDFRGGRPKSRGRMAASIRSWQSLPVGVVSIAEKFGGKDVTPETYAEMVGHVSALLKRFRGRDKLTHAVGAKTMHLVGTSGTVTTLAGLHLGLERYDRAKVDGLWMGEREVADTMRVLLAMDYEKRVANACIGRDRADLVIPGCAIFEAIRQEWPCERVRVADRGLREGILISLMAQDRVWSRRRSGGRRHG